MAKIFKELTLLLEKNLRNLQFQKFLLNTNNQEIGSRYHSFAAKTHIGTFINIFPTLFVLLVLSYSQN